MAYVNSQARSLTLADLRRAAARSRAIVRNTGYGGRGLRGLGAASCPSLEQLLDLTDASDPCQAPATSATVTASVGGFCFSPWFPWVGDQVTGGGTAAVCAPVVQVPSPWAQILTLGLIGLAVMKVAR